MEYEEGIIALMMEALDGELSAAGEAELAAHLRARPDLAAEFEKMQAVDQLLRQTPLLTPPAGFVQRTVQHLPGTRQRLWMGVLVYTVFLAAGVIPLVGLGWAAVQLVPALGQPALWSGLWQAMLALLGALGVILGALAGGAAQLVAEQPATIGWLLLMVLVVVVWGGVFNRLVLQQERT
jgi:anti-sigma factor RsiW